MLSELFLKKCMFVFFSLTSDLDQIPVGYEPRPNPDLEIKKFRDKD